MKTFTSAQVLAYIKKIHKKGFKLDSVIASVPQWQLKKIDLDSLELNEFGEKTDPYNRVLDIDFDHVDDLTDHDIATRPIVADSQGWILDGNHRATKAVELGMSAIPAFVPVLQIEEGALSVDVPTEAWLQDKIDYAKSKGRNSFGVPYMGSTTASVRGAPPRVRVLRLASLPGMRNEQTNVRKDDLKWLMDYMERTGRLPPANDPNEEYLPYIMVAYNGEAWVNEGNHRIMAAYRLNWPDMPIEIRYFDGGERVATGPMAPHKIGLGEVPTNEDLTEAASTGWTALEVVESILGKDRVTADDDELEQGMYYVYESNSPPQFEDTEEPGQTGGAIRLRDLEATDPQSVAEAAHEACHAYAHSKSTSGMLYTNEKIINNLAEIWLKKNLSGTALHFALEHILGSKLHYGPDHMPRSVTEAFDKPYEILRWEKGDFGDVDAIARLDDNTFLSIMFNKGVSKDSKEEAWSVEFYRNNSQEVTGEGDAQRVFATVLSAIQTFIKEYTPNRITFTATKEVEPGQNAQSRARLYDSLVQRYARSWGFRAFRADTGDKVVYELNRIKPVAEARVNPDQNPKPESGFKELAAVAKTITDPQNWAISMTSEPKLGINPQVGISEDTPKGIYFYPLNYALDKTRYGKLPWGNDYPYIQLFQYDRSGEMTKETQVDDAKLKQALRQYCSDEVIQSAIDEPEYDGTPYWTIYDCLSRLGKSDETNIVRWNKVLRDLGFTSVFDDGHGWIAYNEPTQGVVLDPRVIKQLKTIDNKKQSKLVTPAVIERAIFETMDMELAANRAWQKYDPDGSKLRAAAKEYAKKPEFKQYYGKPGTEEIFDKAASWGRYGARELSQEAWEWFKEQQAQPTESITEGSGNDIETIIQSFVASPVGQKYKKHDCKTVTRAFVAWAEQNKIPTQVVSLAPPSAEFIAKNPQFKGKSGQGDGHIMPIVNGNAVDFTVRQFGVSRPFENPLITPTGSLPAVYGKFGYFTDKPEWFLGGKSHWIGALNSIPSEIFNQNFGDELLEHGIMEGGWASAATQNTVITPHVIEEAINVLDHFEREFNAWQAENELDVEMRMGKPVGSGTYYKRDLVADPTREYGDVDVVCYIHSREGVGAARRTSEYADAVKSFADSHTEYNTSNGTNVIMDTSAGPIQVDLIYTYNEHADWARALAPEYQVKGVISTSLMSSVAEVLNMSFGIQGVQVKTRGGRPVSFRQSKDTQLSTVSIDPHNWGGDMYSYYYQLAHGTKPTVPGNLAQHGGLKDEQRLSDIVKTIHALAKDFETAGLFGTGALDYIADSQDFMQKISRVYAEKLDKVINSSKFDKAASPGAVEKANKTRVMLAKYRNEIAKLLVN